MTPDGHGAGPAALPLGSDDASPAFPISVDLSPVDSPVDADVIETACPDAVVAAVLARHAHAARGAYV